MNKEYLPKEKAIYQAVLELFAEGADLNSLTVSEITKKAGIGKGTAYEYFSDKEEMIAKAVFYHAEIFFQRLYEGIIKEKNFYDKVNFVLLTMERQITATSCVFCLLHMMSDNSLISRRMKKLMGQQPTFCHMPAANIIRRLLEDEFKDKETLSEVKIMYLETSVYSKILCFGMLLNEGRCSRPEERETVRNLICQGICREVEEMLTGIPNQ